MLQTCRVSGVTEPRVRREVARQHWQIELETMLLQREIPGAPIRVAVFVGEGAAIPARIRIDDLALDSRPRSEPIDFAEG